MKQEDVATILEKFARDLPEQVHYMLADVDIFICENPVKATEELREQLQDEDGTAWSDSLVEDCKGVFIGEPLERKEGGESEEPEGEMLPEGIIAICCSNIATPEEAVIVLLHEIGHALAMDEEEVRALGLGTEGTPNNVPNPHPNS